MKFIPVHVRDIFLPVMDIDDQIFDGWKYFETKRPIYALNDIYVFNSNIFVKSQNNIFIRILGLSINTNEFLGKETVNNKPGFFEKSKIKNCKKIDIEGDYFLYLPQNPEKNNYWHCLIDNISQLLFVIKYKKIKNILCFDNLSKIHNNYLNLVVKKFNLNLLVIKDKYINIKGRGIYTETSKKTFHYYNSESANKIDRKALDEISKSGFKLYDRLYKTGNFVHRYVIRNDSKDLHRISLKNYSFPFSTPVLKSAFTSFQILKKNKERKIYDRIFIIRNKKDNNSPYKMRFMKNEKKILNIFKKRNFEFLDLGLLSFDEQIEYCSNVKILAGLHGTGFVNSLFMKKNSILLNLIPKNYSMPLTEEVKALAFINELNYQELVSEEIEKDFKSSDFGGFEVPELKLIAILDKLNIN